MQRSKVKDGINSELSRAICRSNVSKVKQLLRTGKVSINGGMSSADPPILECAMSAMYMPAYQNCTKEDESKVLEMLNLLVEHGAEVNIQSSRGMNAAMFTARRGLLRCLEFLVETGVVEYFGTRINRNRFRNILGYFGTIPIYPPPSGRIFRNRQDISEPPPSLWDAQYLTLHNK